MSRREYLVRMYVNRLHGRIAFNGATVLRSWEPRLRKQAMSLVPWCLAGKNTISVDLGLFEDEQLPPPRGEEDIPKFWFHLYGVPRGAQPTNLDLMVRFMWEDVNEAPIDTEETKTVFEHHFYIEERLGDWCWIGATPYRDEDHGGVLDVLKRLHHALATRDAQTVQALLGVRRVELTEALGMDLDAVERDELAFFQSFFDEDDWEMAPFDADALKVVPEAGGRLVRVTALDGGMPLVGRGGTRPFVFDVSMSKIDDRWVVTR